MTPDQLFLLFNNIALFCWIILIFFTFWKQRDIFILNTVVVLLGLAYAWFIFSKMSVSTLKGFSSLDGVSSLFSNKQFLLAGWLHYLAFDLLTGIYIIRNARTYGINQWLLVLPLFFTFMLGPVGLLLYLLVRLVKTKKYMIP